MKFLRWLISLFHCKHAWKLDERDHWGLTEVCPKCGAVRAKP